MSIRLRAQIQRYLCDCVPSDCNLTRLAPQRTRVRGREPLREGAQCVVYNFRNLGHSLQLYIQSIFVAPAKKVTVPVFGAVPKSWVHQNSERGETTSPLHEFVSMICDGFLAFSILTDTVSKTVTRPCATFERSPP